MPQKTYFVTGAAGFVASRLAKALLARGDRVVGHDNLNDYYDVSHKQRHLRDLLGQPEFTFIEGDLRDPDTLKRMFETRRPDAVAHLAAMAAVRYSVKHPLVYGMVNVQGTANVLDAARVVGSIPCVLSSTGSVYGKDTPVPFQEDAPADRPLAPYPASKRAMELFAHAFSCQYGIPTTILRFFNVYGPHGRPDMMPWQLTMKILAGESYPLFVSNGQHLKRDWTYVDDIVDGFVRALDRPTEYEVINLGCGRPVENITIIRTLESLLGKKANIIETPTPSSEPLITYADISKARRLLGYEPKVMVEEGLTRFIDWMRAEKLI